MRVLFCLTVAFVCFANQLSAQSSGGALSGDELLGEYFRKETKKLTDQTFAKIKTLEDWTSQREEYRRQMLEMLGLDPMPKKTPLQPKITGKLEEGGVVVERLHFQSMPGLYVTGNFYRPADQDGPLPAILYVCGHGGERHNGVSLGNKTHYQHHGAWFARNGYVCLTIDTVQLGEIEGIHHGTYREKMWWWNNRGYSSAGVEAYNCLRSVDYLQSRPEVDPERIGVTGRSGGGAYSWWIAAIDERITAAVPVAGITSLKNHVVDGCVEGHCDCMYMVNTYRWDFPMVAALVAPRPLLIANSDKDRIFPLDGVVDVYAKVRKIYRLYDASDKLGLYITEGPHKDTQELRIGAFRWLNRFLRRDSDLIEMAAKPLFAKQDLRVFDQLPDDQINQMIHETFVPKVTAGQLSLQTAEDAEKLVSRLREICFRGWPERNEALAVKEVTGKATIKGARAFEFTSQSPYRLKAFLLHRDQQGRAPLEIEVLDQQSWKRLAPALSALFPGQISDASPDEKAARVLFDDCQCNTAFLLPRGVGPTRWSEKERDQTQIRRRFMLLGQTQAGMQIYDVCRGVKAIQSIENLNWQYATVTGERDAAVWAAYAALMTDGVDFWSESPLPADNRSGPDILNISRVIEMADLKKWLERTTRPAENDVSLIETHVEPNGVIVHSIRSMKQSAPTEIRVLLPDAYSQSRRKHYPTLFVLPVEELDGDRWGDALAEIKNADLHNRYGVICVYPTFSAIPWYADHPTDPGLQQESYLINDVIPFFEQRYRGSRCWQGRSLLGFSKSGWGAWSLLSRNTDQFSRAAAWDAPLLVKQPNKYRMQEVFAGDKHFQQYDLRRSLQSASQSEKYHRLTKYERLMHFGYGNFRDQHLEAEQLLDDLKIRRKFVDGPKLDHAWSAEWMDVAMDWLFTR